jgi:hypothetical protein
MFQMYEMNGFKETDQFFMDGVFCGSGVFLFVLMVQPPCKEGCWE